MKKLITIVLAMGIASFLFSSCNGKNAKQRKKTVDAVAAALMLEGYLTRKKLEGAR